VEHDFTLVLAGVDRLDPSLVNALYEAGCDDATAAQCEGCIRLAFTRTAPSLRDAVVSAIGDATRAGMTVARLDADDLATPDPEPEAARVVASVNATLAYLHRRRDDARLVDAVVRVAGFPATAGAP
jgi:hypothetical protein